MNRYRVRRNQRYRYWTVTAHPGGSSNSSWSHWVGDFGTWEFAMWVATGDRRYRQSGFMLVPSFFVPHEGTAS